MERKRCYKENMNFIKQLKNMNFIKQLVRIII